MASHPGFSEMHVAGRGEFVLRSPLDAQICAERIATAVKSETGLMSTRLYGTIDGWEFKVRHASAIDLGAMTKWAEGTLERSGEETLIRFKFGPLRFLKWIMQFNSIVFTCVSFVLATGLVAQLLRRPADGVSDDLIAMAIIFPVMWLFIFSFGRILDSAAEPGSLIRLFGTLLEAEVIQRPDKKID